MPISVKSIGILCLTFEEGNIRAFSGAIGGIAGTFHPSWVCFCDIKLVVLPAASFPGMSRIFR